MKQLTNVLEMKRNRKRKGCLMMQRHLRKVNKEYCKFKKSLGFYKNNEYGD